MTDAKPKYRVPAGSGVYADGWSNVLTGLGNARLDPTERSKPIYEARLPERELEAIYRSDGIGRRIVDVAAEDMTRQWISVEHDDGEAIIAKLEDINAQDKINQAIRWARLYGGSGVVIGANDGGRLDEPLNTSRLIDIEFLRVYDRWRIWFSTADYYTDPSQANYGRPQRYYVQPIQGVPYHVHESRMLIFDGEDVPERIRVENNGWGDSSLQPAYRRLSRMGQAESAVANIMRDFITSVMGMKGLTDLIGSGQDELVKSRINILDLTRSVLNSLVIDADGETYTKNSSSVAGLPDLMDRLMMMICAATGYPMTKLFGRSPAGLSATGDADIRQYYDWIAGEQRSRLRPPIERLIGLIYQSREGPTRGREPDDWKFEFKPLWQPTEAERATAINTAAQGIGRLAFDGLISHEDARDNLRNVGVKVSDDDDMDP